MIPLLLLVLNLTRIDSTPCITQEDGDVVCVAEIRNPEVVTEETVACFDADGYLLPCPERGRHVGEYLVRALAGRGIDVFTGAVAFEAGAVEGNKIQPTPEHRAGISLLLVGAQVGVALLIERLWGHKAARLFSRVGMWLQVGVGGWNLSQAWKAQHAAVVAP